MTCRSDRDIYSALSAWPWLLFQWRSWRRTRGFRGGRSFVISIFDRALKVNGQILLGVFVKDEQSCQVKLNVCAVLQTTLFLSKLVEGLLLYTWYFYWLFILTCYITFKLPFIPAFFGEHVCFIPRGIFSPHAMSFWRNATVLDQYVNVVLADLPNVFCWRHPEFNNPHKDFYLADGVHLNPSGQYLLYRSYRGAVLKAVGLLQKTWLIVFTRVFSHVW